MSTISVVIPVFNEEDCLEALFERLIKLDLGADDYEFIFVDDGSTDNSREIIKKLAAEHESVKYLLFSRNFGHEAATTAGLDHATGDAVVIIDADLQDPPEVVPELVVRWRQGNHVVYAQRKSRKDESVAKRFSSWLFYRIVNKLSSVNIPIDTGDFRLMDRAVVEQFRRCREQNRFVRGLVSWAGFKQVPYLYDRDARYGGKTKYGVVRLVMLAFDAVLSFSTVPLLIGIHLGLLMCAVCFCIGVWIMWQKMSMGIPMPGYALTVTGIFFIGGMQLSMLGLVGEYICRIYRQSQGRPLYIVQEKTESLPAGVEGLAGNVSKGKE